MHIGSALVPRMVREMVRRVVENFMFAEDGLLMMMIMGDWEVFLFYCC